METKKTLLEVNSRFVTEKERTKTKIKTKIKTKKNEENKIKY